MVWPFRKPPMILFLGGLSGAGKSSFARDHLQSNHGWRHIEIDIPHAGDGIDGNGLRGPWNEFQPPMPFQAPRKPGRLHRAIGRMAAGHTHVVLSFSSRQIFTERQLEIGQAFFHFAYLSGPAALCRQGFLERLKKEGSISGPSPDAEKYWHDHNDDAIGKLNLPYNHALVIEAFRPDGARRDPEAIYKDLLDVMKKQRRRPFN